MEKPMNLFEYFEQNVRIKHIQESMVVEYDTINEAYNVSNNRLKATIKVYGNEGQTPHFHVMFSGHECCFCIFEAKYFNHELHHVKMTDSHLFGLNVFLMSPVSNKVDPNDKKLNYWDMIVQEWVTRNTTEPYEHMDDWQSQKKPNYTQATENKYIGKNNNFKSSGKF